MPEMAGRAGGRGEGDRAGEAREREIEGEVREEWGEGPAGQEHHRHHKEAWTTRASSQSTPATRGSPPPKP